MGLEEEDTVSSVVLTETETDSSLGFDESLSSGDAAELASELASVEEERVSGTVAV